eukprot:gene7885-8697_t
MSNIYHTEPPTQGKVVIKTSHDIELWSKEAPLACRNFIQLALEGYYDSTIIHRVIKGFMIQLGDATGTGQGGSSIYNDQPFKSEIHGRIKFNHRGQVAMACDKPHNNLSQFFITLDKCDWLNGKHTIFGKVTGNTIYNVLKIGEVEVDGADRPLDSLRVTKIEVLWNPFDDLLPRSRPVAQDRQEDSKKKKGASKAVAVRDSKLLSFSAPDDEDDEEEVIQVKFKSAHDAKTRTLQTSRPLVETNPAALESSAKAIDKDTSLPNQQKKGQSHQGDVPVAQGTKKFKSENDEAEEEDNDDLPTTSEDMMARLSDARREQGREKVARDYESLKAQLMQARKAVAVLTGQAAEQRKEEVAKQGLLTPLEQRRLMYRKRKADHGDRAEETLSRLKDFTEKLRAQKASLPRDDPAPTKDQSYHGQVLEETDDQATNDIDKGWFAGPLRFTRHVDDNYRFRDMLSAQQEASNSYISVDPLKHRGSSGLGEQERRAASSGTSGRESSSWSHRS